MIEIDELRKEKRALMDTLQVSEMRLSEEIDQHRREVRLKREAEKHATYWRKQVDRSRVAAADARENENRMKRQLVLAEREARSLNFQNLSLSRKLELLADALPRSEYNAMRQRLEGEVEAHKERIAALEADIAERDAADQQLLDKASEGEVSTDRKRARATVMKLRQSVGIDPTRQAPARRCPSTSEAGEKVWAKRSIHHIAAVLHDRPMSHILRALRHRHTELAECAEFASESKRIVSKAMSVIVERWSARLSVHVWDRLELSRRRMDDLMHLLSFVYDPTSDKYHRIIVWTNPNDEKDVVVMPRLVGREGREKLFAQMADECGITVGDNGRCERDAVKCAAMLYSRFNLAMRTDFSSDLPARPILFFDGTGGSLGKGITHAELGSADFAGDCKQSRSTLSPLALYADTDHALPLRANLSLCMQSFNALSDGGVIECTDGRSIPCEPIVVGDMQGVKSIMGMSESCHSVWCKCRARAEVNGEGSQHKYGAKGSTFNNYEEMLHFFEEVKCEFKSEDFMLACAHLSKGLFYGRRFTSFTCPECGYSPSEVKAKADLAKFNAMTDDEQKSARKEHVAGGRHWHVELYMGPMPKGFGMRRVGVDQLHLVYLNMFKHLFKYTIHEALPNTLKVVVAQYLRAAGYYSYDADSDTDDPVKGWIGREVKRFLHEADQHLPFLLQLAAGQSDVSAETLAATNENGEEEMDLSGDEFEPTAEEVAAETSELPLLQLNAERWDTFLKWVAGIETPWDEDSLEYRKQRALQYCNGARATARALHELKPTMQSWVPHIACNIVPRQIVELGDPSRRAADACESMGACTKKVIKHLTCRRNTSAKFRVGYIEQAFRRLSVRSELLHGVDNMPFLQRKDALLLGLGRSSVVRDRVLGPAHSIRVKVEQEAALA